MSVRRRCLCVVLLAAPIVAVTIAIGYDSQNAADRLAESRQAIAESQPIVGRVAHDKEALAAIGKCLTQASTKTLRKPEICLARLFPVGDRQALVVYWIEEMPSVDAIRLNWKNRAQQYYVDVYIDDATRTAHQEEALGGVLFPACFYFPFAVVNPNQLHSQAGISIALLKKADDRVRRISRRSDVSMEGGKGGQLNESRKRGRSESAGQDRHGEHLNGTGLIIDVMLGAC